MIAHDIEVVPSAYQQIELSAECNFENLKQFAEILAYMMGKELERFSSDAKGFESRFAPTYWLQLTGVPIEYFNIGFINDSKYVNNVLHSMYRYLNRLGLPGMVYLTEHSFSQLTEQARRQWTDVGVMPHMVLVQKTPLPTEFAKTPIFIQPVTNLSQLSEAISIQAALGFDPNVIGTTMGEKLLTNPAVQTYVATDFDTEIPVSTIMVISQGPVVGIWNMATKEQFQHKGIGKALLVHVLNQLISQGKYVFQLISTEEGFKLYSETGFKIIQELHTLVKEK